MTDAIVEKIEPGMTRAVRKNLDGEELVTIVFDPFAANEFTERMENYKEHRRKNPVRRLNLCYYADYCNRRGRPIDANVVGLSLDLLALHHYEDLKIINLPNPHIAPWFRQYNIFFSYN